jgi:Gpi18-like mannosyltransferase
VNRVVEGRWRAVQIGIVRRIKGSACPTFILVALIAGLGARLLLIGNVSEDARDAFLVWYEYAHAHGAAALRVNFTNYQPFYSYLLLLLAQLDRLAPPLVLIKAASAVFELGCAMIAANIVHVTGGERKMAALSFACVWLAPTVLVNGAYWAQTESMWTLFVLLSIRLFLVGRNGVPAFGFSFAVKAQGAFLGPFVLGMVLSRRVHWVWLASIPAIYIIVGAPVLIAGRSLVDLSTIYVAQADYYNVLTKNAASLWVFVPIDVHAGTMIGLAVAFAAGVWLAVQTARIDPGDRERILLAGCASLLLMPFLLPKMHDRYFYAFEVATIALACRNPRYVAVAVMAQANGLISCMMFDWRLPPLALAPAALCNAALAAFFVIEVAKPAAKGRLPIAHLATFTVCAIALVAALAINGPGRGVPVTFPYLAVAFCFFGVILLLRTRRGGIKPIWQPATAR